MSLMLFVILIPNLMNKDVDKSNQGLEEMPPQVNLFATLLCINIWFMFATRLFTKLWFMHPTWEVANMHEGFMNICVHTA